MSSKTDWRGAYYLTAGCVFGSLTHALIGWVGVAFSLLAFAVFLAHDAWRSTNANGP